MAISLSDVKLELGKQNLLIEALVLGEVEKTEVEIDAHLLAKPNKFIILGSKISTVFLVPSNLSGKAIDILVMVYRAQGWEVLFTAERCPGGKRTFTFTGDLNKVQS